MSRSPAGLRAAIARLGRIETELGSGVEPDPERVSRRGSKMTEWLWVGGAVVAYFAVTRWVLPRFGIRT